MNVSAVCVYRALVSKRERRKDKTSIHVLDIVCLTSRKANPPSLIFEATNNISLKAEGVSSVAARLGLGPQNKLVLRKGVMQSYKPWQQASHA